MERIPSGKYGGHGLQCKKTKTGLHTARVVSSVCSSLTWSCDAHTMFLPKISAVAFRMFMWIRKYHQSPIQKVISSRWVRYKFRVNYSSKNYPSFCLLAKSVCALCVLSVAVNQPEEIADDTHVTAAPSIFISRPAEMGYLNLTPSRNHSDVSAPSVLISDSGGTCCWCFLSATWTFCTEQMLFLK